MTRCQRPWRSVVLRQSADGPSHLALYLRNEVCVLVLGQSIASGIGHPRGESLHDEDHLTSQIIALHRRMTVTHATQRRSQCRQFVPDGFGEPGQRTADARGRIRLAPADELLTAELDLDRLPAVALLGPYRPPQLGKLQQVRLGSRRSEPADGMRGHRRDLSCHSLGAATS